MNETWSVCLHVCAHTMRTCVYFREEASCAVGVFNTCLNSFQVLFMWVFLNPGYTFESPRKLKILTLGL